VFIYLFIYYTVYAHVKSFTIVKNRKCVSDCGLERRLFTMQARVSRRSDSVTDDAWSNGQEYWSFHHNMKLLIVHQWCSYVAV